MTEASYAYLFKGEIACTAEARPDILVDLAADRTVLGIEVLGDGILDLTALSPWRLREGSGSRRSPTPSPSHVRS